MQRPRRRRERAAGAAGGPAMRTSCASGSRWREPQRPRPILTLATSTTTSATGSAPASSTSATSSCAGAPHVLTDLGWRCAPQAVPEALARFEQRRGCRTATAVALQRGGGAGLRLQEMPRRSRCCGGYASCSPTTPRWRSLPKRSPSGAGRVEGRERGLLCEEQSDGDLGVEIATAAPRPAMTTRGSAASVARDARPRRPAPPPLRAAGPSWCDRPPGGRRAA